MRAGQYGKPRIFAKTKSPWSNSDVYLVVSLRPASPPDAILNRAENYTMEIILFGRYLIALRFDDKLSHIHILKKSIFNRIKCEKIHDKELKIEKELKKLAEIIMLKKE